MVNNKSDNKEAEHLNLIHTIIADINERIIQHQQHMAGYPFDAALVDDIQNITNALEQADNKKTKEICRDIKEFTQNIQPNQIISQGDSYFLFDLFTSLSATIESALPQNTLVEGLYSSHSMKSHRSKHTVYLAEQNPSEAKEIGSQIGYYGYSVKYFSQLSDLISEIDVDLPHAIIINTTFFENEMNSIETSSYFSDLSTENIPVIYISEEDNIHVRLNAVKNDGNAFFTKPIDFSNLIDVLDRFTAPANEEPYRVMIVEDTLLQAKLFALTLNKNGIETKIITDPLKILVPLKEFNPDLILLDMYMPACTGMELAKVIRQMEYYVSIPIVYLSAETDMDKQLAAMSEGADDFLAKPIKPNHLITAVTSRVKRYRKLRSLMLYDGLTGLFNHTTTLDRLSQELSRSQRQNEEMVFAMLDLDEFKKVNDTYGHSTGDNVLKSLSLLLKQRLRKSDIVGRLGGEEFGVILPNTSIEAAEALMNQLRENFANIHHRYKNEDFLLTFSCGIASSRTFPSPDLITEEADQALYQAKHQGRNQVVFRVSNTMI